MKPILQYVFETIIVLWVLSRTTLRIIKYIKAKDWEAVSVQSVLLILGIILGAFLIWR